MLCYGNGGGNELKVDAHPYTLWLKVDDSSLYFMVKS